MDEFKRRRLRQDEGRRWSDLPDRGTGGDFLALSRVCRAWRTVAKTSIRDFASSRHCLSQYIFLILGRSQHPYTSGYSDLFLCIADGLLYEHKPRIKPLEVMPKCKFMTHRDEIFVIGQSRNCIIAVDAATRRIPSIIELCCGRRYDFPPLRGKHKLDFALLTESLSRTPSRCMLVLVDSHSSPGRGRLLYCYLGGSKWHSASHPGPIIDAIVCFNMLVINCSTSLLFLRLDKPRHVIHRRTIPAVAREGEGKPFLVLNHHLFCRHLMLLKLTDKSDSVLAYTCYCLQNDGSEHIVWEKYPWPVASICVLWGYSTIVLERGRYLIAYVVGILYHVAFKLIWNVEDLKLGPNIKALSVNENGKQDSIQKDGFQLVKTKRKSVEKGNISEVNVLETKENNAAINSFQNSEGDFQNLTEKWNEEIVLEHQVLGRDNPAQQAKKKGNVF
ncbi:hypothetical protein AXF42_Ash013673 [Apostasia shenzhenica]|uniref:Uncharacterized protein n=1 Tax=Apostasia shenzhenica TaxID=1088818 RepID=A0A2I0APN8_9ASPA|nr:hypothetical protein AXF42_Ash013673 [Apostasia shenzhenica]